MDYEIVMPVLSDTMESGKLIKWHVNEGDEVKKGDVIAEVESDKAIMEVQTFQDGIVKKLLIKEGDEVPVKSPIAIIERTKESSKPMMKQEESLEKNSPKEKIEDIIEESLQEPSKKIVEGVASPAAKKEAAKSGIDIEKLQQEQKLPKPAHLRDIQQEKLKRYFTPKALKLIKEYRIDPKSFQLDHKISEDEVLDFIKANNIPKSVPLSSNQRAVIKNVIQSAQKPTFFIYETFHIKPYQEYKLTSIFIKLLADVMQNHPKTRALLQEDCYLIYPNSNISIAVAKGDELYMVVCKKAESKSIDEIDAWVRNLKKKAYTKEELERSTFGISNLGMFGIERFSAMINNKDVGIAAFGAVKEERVKVTFTFDHRIINGVEAALFVEELKNAFEKGV